MASNNVVIDLTNYMDRSGARVDEGRYTVRIAGVELDETRNGDDMINVFLEVVDPGQFEGATIVDRLLPNHPKAQFRIVNFMRALGLPTPRKRLNVNIAAWTGKVLEVDVEDGDEYRGIIRSEVRGYLPSSKKQAAKDIEDVSEESEEIEEVADTSDDVIDLDDLEM